MQEKTRWKGSKNPRTPFAKFEYLSEYIMKRKEELGYFPRITDLCPAAINNIRVYHCGYTNVKARIGGPLKWRYSSFSFKNWPILKNELEEVIKDLGYFPSSEDLRKIHRNDIRGAIETIHGGFPAVREKMGLSQVILNGDKSLSVWGNFKVEIKNISDKIGHFPAIKELRRIGRFDIICAAKKYYGGFVAARSRLGVKPPIKTGSISLKHFDNIKKEILDLEKKLGYFPSATDVQAFRQDVSSSAQVYHGGYKKLAEKIGRPVKKRKHVNLDNDLKEIIINGLKNKPEGIKEMNNYYTPLIKRFVYGIDPRYKDALYSRALEIFESVRKGAKGPEQFAVGFWRSLRTELSHEYMRLKTGYRINTSDLIKIRFIRRHMAKFTEKNNRPATIKELEDTTGYTGYNLARLIHLQEPLSMDKKIGDTELTFGDTISEKQEKITGPKILENIEDSDLNQIEKELLIKKFGLDGEDPKTFTMLSKEYSMTRPGVKQKINDALLRLKNSS